MKFKDKIVWIGSYKYGNKRKIFYVNGSRQRQSKSKVCNGK